MFFKIVKSKEFYYLQLVHSYRLNGKTKQQVILNFGSVDQLKKSGFLERTAKKLLKLDGKSIPTINDLEELSRFCYGDIVYRKLWNRYRIDELLKECRKHNNIKYDFETTVYLMVIDRLLRPQSKLATFNKQGRYIGIKDVSLHHLYRSLDILADKKKQIERHLFDRSRSLFNTKIDVVFYDVTTFGFQSLRSDELKEFGYSKSGRFNEVQVVMGLLIDTEGHPIGFEVFAGNTFDGKTVITSLKKLEEDFQIRQVIIVADAGINSAKNLYQIKQAGYEYIIRARLRSFSNSLKQQILNEEGYVDVGKDDNGEVSLRYKNIEDHSFEYVDTEGKRHRINDRIIVYWSKELSERNKTDRQRAIKKAEQVVSTQRSINDKKGYRRYIQTEGKGKVMGIDQRRIEEDSRLDGYMAIESSVRDLDVVRIIEEYHQLWKIEESFRVLKTTMQTEPIFVWTPKRIIGHFVTCFIAFLLERVLEGKVKKNGITATAETIREAVNSLELSEVKYNENVFYLRSKHNPLASKILNILKIKHLKNVIDKEEISSYLS